jgi:hypothetical protein
VFVLLTDHETGDILQEHQRDPALGTKLDKMRALQCGFRKQDAVVGDNADRNAIQVRESAD